MTMREILNDLKSDRVKKVILDTDAYNEIDDQFAIAYFYYSKKVDLLAVTAEHYMHDRCNSKEVGMKRSYDEIVKVLSLADPHYTTETYRGSVNTIDELGTYVESDAADAIIRIARESDEMVYVVAIGALTNVTSAILKVPDIKEKICVIWLGGNEISDRTLEKGCHEWNMYADFKASQILLSSDIPLLMLHAGPNGSGNIVMTFEDFQKFGSQWDGPWVEQFYSRVLPRTSGVTLAGYTHGWSKIMCDYAGMAALSCPEAMELKIISAPTLEDDGRYTLNPNNKRIIWGEGHDSDLITADAIKWTLNLIERAKKQ